MTVRVLVTRDLQRFRKPTESQQLFAELCTAFLQLLCSPTLEAQNCRSAFLSALLGIETRPPRGLPMNLADFGHADDQALVALFTKVVEGSDDSPTFVLVQGNLTQSAVEAGWKKLGTTRLGTGGLTISMDAAMFVSLAIVTELEFAKSNNDREEQANLSIMLLATVTYQLAHWIYVKHHGYHPPQRSPILSNNSALSTSIGALSIGSSSASSLGSVQSSATTLHTPSADVGMRAVHVMFACTFELWTFIIGHRRVIKKRIPTRRQAALSPPLVYRLIGDTPAILDLTHSPPTRLGEIPSWKPQEAMYAVSAVLTPVGGHAFYHGICVVKDDS